MELVCGDDHKPAGAGRDEAEFLMLAKRALIGCSDLSGPVEVPVEKQVKSGFTPKYMGVLPAKSRGAGLERPDFRLPG